MVRWFVRHLLASEIPHNAHPGRTTRVCAALCAALACFALIRRWRDTFPTRGKASFGCAKSFTFYFSFYFSFNFSFYFSFYFSILLVNRRCIYQLRTAAVAFPRVGKVARSDG